MSCPNKLSFIEVEDEFLLLLCLYLNALDFWVRCTYFVVHTRASNFHIILRLTNYVTGDLWKCAALLFRWHNFKNEIILFNMQWMSNDEDVDYVRAFKCKYLLMLHTHNLKLRFSTKWLFYTLSIALRFLHHKPSEDATQSSHISSLSSNKLPHYCSESVKTCIKSSFSRKSCY